MLALGSAGATPVSVTSGYQVEGLGFYSGTLDYVASSSTNASLTLQLTNLASTSAGGNITAVAFNLPTESGVTFSGLSSTGPTGFVQLGSYVDTNSINASPIGYFDFGSALANSNGMGTPSWIGGGSPNSGIAVNSSGTFVFNFTGSNLDTLSTLSFVNAVAPGYSEGPPEFIAVRFKGFTNGLSDKVGGFDPVNPPAVPVPASAWLLLSGLGGLGVLSRRKAAKPN